MKKNSLYILLFAVTLLGPSPLSKADIDVQYQFITEDGFAVTFPEEVTLHSQEDPGPYKDVAHWHIPKITDRIQVTAAERRRIMRIEIPHPQKKDKDGYIREIYIRDKDGLVIGYAPLSAYAESAVKEITIDSVINFIQIDIMCSQHDTWHSEVRFNHF